MFGDSREDVEFTLCSDIGRRAGVARVTDMACPISPGLESMSRTLVRDGVHYKIIVLFALETVFDLKKEFRIQRGSPSMCRLTKCALSIFAVILVLLSLPASAVASVTTYTGTLPDGATFLIEVPSPWNGTLLLYSHGYVIPGAQNPAQDVGDPATGAFLLSNGFGLAGSSYAHTGWAIQEALPDQIAVLDTFAALVGTPSRTIVWGHSLGGIITAGLIQRFPDRFDAALPMCGVLSGDVGTWNQALDSEFAFKTLL